RCRGRATVSLVRSRRNAVRDARRGRMVEGRWPRGYSWAWYSALVAEGKRLFNDQGCYGCHTMGASGTPIAPDLSTVDSKHTETSLRAWLRDPKQQKPRAHMPKLELTDG